MDTANKTNRYKYHKVVFRACARKAFRELNKLADGTTPQTEKKQKQQKGKKSTGGRARNLELYQMQVASSIILGLVRSYPAIRKKIKRKEWFYTSEVFAALIEA
ncbi:hypothetical protein FVR03_23455 [Pontibacter qinzhouensis]|uniref:Uncharacterized protein n=1 Tax=Pontibacter qinzhouensis TaxID=2603253 RepID=A0A5C8IJM8_9BACT|nr:hypothetical protein [Pontibacter qinzhouensis]TXK21242.1 hypothetical protein FVR03_23455 [Pontibacter qinzhouensis]